MSGGQTPTVLGFMGSCFHDLHYTVHDDDDDDDDCVWYLTETRHLDLLCK